MRKLGLQLLIGVCGIASLNAQTVSQPSARLAIRSGLVEIERGNVWMPVTPGESLSAGERIRTASGSTAALEIGSGRVITLNEQSQLQIGQSGSSIVQLENGSMKVFSLSDIQVAAKDTILESADSPLDLELGYQAGKLNLMVFSGAVQNGSMTIRGGNQEPTMRVYRAGRVGESNATAVPNSTFYIYPYFLYGTAGPNPGAIVPPVVNNPTNPGYRPTQIVPPMSDPIRVPTARPAVPAQAR